MKMNKTETAFVEKVVDGILAACPENFLAQQAEIDALRGDFRDASGMGASEFAEMRGKGGRDYAKAHCPRGIAEDEVARLKDEVECGMNRITEALEWQEGVQARLAAADRLAEAAKRAADAICSTAAAYLELGEREDAAMLYTEDALLQTALAEYDLKSPQREEGRLCRDGGKCHHSCRPDDCYRERTCGNLSSYNGPWGFPAPQREEGTDE